jgi:hypothetical protein
MHIQALHLQPHDKAILYNIAMIEQKAAEMLFSVAPAKRTLADLEKAINQAGHAQKCVSQCLVPYSLKAKHTIDCSRPLPATRQPRCHIMSSSPVSDESTVKVCCVEVKSIWLLSGYTKTRLALRLTLRGDGDKRSENGKRHLRFVANAFPNHALTCYESVNESGSWKKLPRSWRRNGERQGSKHWSGAGR